MSVWRSTCVLWPMASAPTLLVGTSVPVQLAIPETEFGVTRRMSAEEREVMRCRPLRGERREKSFWKCVDIQ